MLSTSLCPQLTSSIFDSDLYGREREREKSKTVSAKHYILKEPQDTMT